LSLLGLLFMSAMMLYFVEHTKSARIASTQSDRTPTTKSAFAYEVFSIMTGMTTMAPKTTAGRIYSFSLGFSLLIVLSAYTANLASVLVASRPLAVSSIEQVVAEGATVCTWKGGLGSNWFKIKKLYPQVVLHEVRDTKGAFSALKAGKCKAMLDGVSSSQLAMADQDNDCIAQMVGPQLSDSKGAFVMGERHYCLQQTFDAILQQMQDDGIQAKMWQDIIDRRTCSQSTSESSTELGVAHFMGVGILHAAFTGVALMCHFCLHHDEFHPASDIRAAARRASHKFSKANEAQSPREISLQEIDDSLQALDNNNYVQEEINLQEMSMSLQALGSQVAAAAQALQELAKARALG